MPSGRTGGLGPGGEVDAVVLDGVKELPPFAREPVGDLGGQPPREDTGVLPFLDVFAATLDEMGGQFLAELQALVFGEVQQATEPRSQKGKKVVEGGIVAGVRGGGEEEQVAVSLFGELLEQGEAELLALS